MYAADLEANLQDLSARLKRLGYRPHPKRRIDLPKPGSEQGRPLGISSFEDKIVELATQRVLEPLFEPLFDDCSYGYRPQRSPHQCLDALGRTLQQKRGKAASSPCLRPGSTLALRGRGFHPFCVKLTRVGYGSCSFMYHRDIPSM